MSSSVDEKGSVAEQARKGAAKKPVRKVSVKRKAVSGKGDADAAADEDFAAEDAANS